jgi:hypothetical protein
MNKNNTLLLNLLIITMILLCNAIWSSDNNITNDDKNYDGRVDGLSKILGKTSSVLANFDTTMIIGIINTDGADTPFDRLQNLGYNNINLIPAQSGLETFLQHDVIYLPVGWAQGYGGAPDTILQYSEDYKTYVTMGGGLFLEQPNPYTLPGDSLVVTLLPVPVTFHYFYNQDDYPPVVVDPLHEITNGLSGDVLPFPADSIPSLDAMYHVLVQGRISGNPSLFVAEYGSGKILVHTAHPSATATHPFSDTAYMRMINWVKSEITSIDGGNIFLPEKIILQQNYPNPFNPVTTISYTIPNSGNIMLEISDILGQEVETMVDKFQTAGRYTIQFNAKNLPSGIYFYKLQLDNHVIKTKKMILLR